MVGTLIEEFVQHKIKSIRPDLIPLLPVWRSAFIGSTWRKSHSELEFHTGSIRQTQIDQIFASPHLDVITAKEWFDSDHATIVIKLL